MRSLVCKGKKTREARDALKWEARLRNMGLGMNAGLDSGWLMYGHMVEVLDFDGRQTYTPPTGESLDKDEWPISLC